MTQPGSDVLIRTASPADIEPLRALPFSAGMPAKHDDRLARQETREAAYLLAIQDNAIVGHLYLKRDGPGHPAVRALVPACAEIEDFVVDPGWRNQGIGSALLDDATRRARDWGATALGLAVGTANPGARRLYERHGYRRVPDSGHRVTWRTADQAGREFDAYEVCIYLLKELS